MGEKTSETGARERGEGLAWLALLALPLALIGPSLLPGQRFLPLHPVGFAPIASEHPEDAARLAAHPNYLASDRLFPLLTDQMAMREQLLAGSLPTWEPRQGLGAPLFAGTLAGGLYPPNWLQLALPPDAAGGWLALLSLFLAGLGVALYLSRRGLTPGAALIGGLAVQAGGFGIANLHLLAKVDAALWLPWQLWAIEGLLTRRRRAGAWLAASTALSFLAGFPPIAVFSAAAALLYALARAGARIPREMPRVSGWLALGLAAASVQLLPTVEASLSSHRGPRSAENIMSEALPLSTSATIVSGDLFGRPDEATFAPHNPAAWWLTDREDAGAAQSANPLEWNLFATVVATVLSIAALVGDPRRACIPGLLLLAGIAFAQGWPGAGLLYALPGLNLGAPARAAAVTWIFLPILAGLGAQSVAERRPRAVGAALIASFLLTAGGFAFWNGIDPQTFAAELEQTLAERHGISPEEVREIVRPVDALETGRRLVASGAQLFSSAAATLLALVAVVLLRRRPETFARGPRLGTVIGAPLVVAALALAGGHAARYANAASGAGVAPASWVGLAVAGVLLLLVATWRARGRLERAAWLPLGAVLVVEGITFGAPHVSPRSTGDTELFPDSRALAAVSEATGDGRVVRYDPTPSGVEDVQDLARPGLPQAYGTSDLTPYAVFTPRWLVELWTALDPRGGYRSGISRLPDLRWLDHPILDLVRVTAVLSKHPIDHPRLELVFAGDDFHVYRRPGVRPLAEVVDRAVTTRSDETALGLLSSGTAARTGALVLAPGVAGPAPDTAPGEPFRPGTLEVSRSAPNRLDIRVEETSGGWLVMREGWYPDWKCTVNGADAELVRVDHAFRAVRIGPGTSLVRTWYEPWSLRIGALASLLSVAAILVLDRRARRGGRSV